MKKTATAASVPLETEITGKVESLQKRMSLAEQVGQPTQLGGQDFIPGLTPGSIPTHDSCTPTSGDVTTWWDSLNV